MSFIDQTQDPRRRVTAIAGVAIVHAVLGIGVVTGLTIAGVGPLAPVPKPIIDFPIDPPPIPDPSPAPTNPVDQTAPTPPAPVPPVPFPQPTGPDRVPFDETDVIFPDVPVRPDPGPSTRPEPPRPPAFTPQRARPSNAQSRWITNDDYPARALRDEIEGMAAYRLVVGSNGRVSACEITASTGNRALDDATCRLISARARFDAATDGSGARVVGDFTGTVRWQIPD
jgi:protein TonB